MAKAKSTKQAADGQVSDDGVEPMVIALAEQLGTFIGRVQAKADGWLDNEALRQQAAQIRDGAANLLKHVTRSSEAARAAATPAAPKRQAREGEPAPPKPQGTKGQPGRSGGTVDAPGKRHRKPPTQVRIDKRMGEVQGKKAGQKQFKVGKSRGRG